MVPWSVDSSQLTVQHGPNSSRLTEDALQVCVLFPSALDLFSRGVLERMFVSGLSLSRKIRFASAVASVLYMASVFTLMSLSTLF